MAGRQASNTSMNFENMLRKKLNLKKKKKERIQLFQLLIIALLPCLVLVVQNAMWMNDTIYSSNTKERIVHALEFSLEITVVVDALQKEREISIFQLDPESNLTLPGALNETYDLTDQVLMSLGQWPTLDTPEHFQSRESFYRRIVDFRKNLTSDSTTTTIDDILTFYDLDTSTANTWVADTLQTPGVGNIWSDILAYVMLTMSVDEGTICRALGIAFLFNTSKYTHW
jgi:hypothetical protein